MEGSYESWTKGLGKNNTWRLVDLPSGHRVIGSMWVFAIKRNEKGEIERYKARLVAKGWSQKFGDDYKETFSPEVRYATIRMLLALAVERKMHLHQVDISTAYLNSDFNDEIYIQQPEGFVNKIDPTKVLKLKKSLYGLKQAGRNWNERLGKVLHEMGLWQWTLLIQIYHKQGYDVSSRVCRWPYNCKQE